MQKKKLLLQILTILALVLLFVLLNTFFYNTFTKRYVSGRDERLKAKSIELDEYLPFDPDTNAVVIDTTFKLTGDLPRIDGAAALYPVFSSIVGSTYPSDSVSFNGTDFTEDSCLHMNNTRSAYEEIVTGEADIVFCAYPSEEQLSYAADNGVELVFVPIGREAFVFFVNENNPVDGLTSDEIRGIYSGRIRNWNEVGGADYLITPLRRNEGSGSQTAMNHFMNGEEIPVDYDAVLGRAIGFSFRYYVSELTNYGGIKILSVDGVYPSVDNIRNGTYPITSEFYAVYRSDNTNPNVPALIEWVLSEEGQALIEANGYVRIN